MCYQFKFKIFLRVCGDDAMRHDLDIGMVKATRGKNKKFGEGGPDFLSSLTSGGLRPPDPPKTIRIV